MSRWWLVIVVALGCRRSVPPHLLVPDKVDEAALVETFDDTSTVVSWMMRNDPLARTPQLPPKSASERLDGLEPLMAFVTEVETIEQGSGRAAIQFRNVSNRFEGSLAEPFVRGGLLRRAERLLVLRANGSPTPELTELLLPLRSAESDAGLGGDALDHLGDVPAIRRFAERWVLQGWLAAPDLPLEGVQAALQQPQYDGLSASPIGRIIEGRSTGTASPEAGMKLLEKATELALMRAAADRDDEQMAWGRRQQAEMVSLGGTVKPTVHYLDGALDALVDAASDDSAAGSAMVAATGLRLLDGCAQTPCVGVDRVSWLSDAERYPGRAAELARVWKVIALKDAIDTMEVGHNTVLFPNASVQLTDALIGTRAGTVRASLLLRGRPAPGTWDAIGQAVGSTAVLDWSTARVALGHHLAEAADQALADPGNAGASDLLTRIRDRASR